MKALYLALSAAVFAAVYMRASPAPLEIDPRRSSVEVDVSSTVDSFVGRLEKYQAVIEGDPKVALPTRAELSFDLADLKTGNKDRDAAMLKWLHYESHRTASFQLTGWKQKGGVNMALGQLTINGVRVEVEMLTAVNHHDAEWDISGQTVVDYLSFDLPKIRKALVLTVDPHLTIKFHLVGTIAPEK